MNDGEERGLVPVPMPGEVDEASDDVALPLFVYGALIDEEFVSNLLEHPVTSEPASLPDFGHRPLGRTAWPLLFPAQGESVPGRLYRGFDAEDMRRLDAYGGVGEGLYRRLPAPVESEEKGAAARETAYVYLPTAKTLRRYR